MSDRMPKRGQCLKCDRDLFTGDTLVYEEAVGWTKKRKKGGPNTFAIPQKTGRLMCYMCMDKAKRGLIHQETLL